MDFFNKTKINNLVSGGPFDSISVYIPIQILSLNYPYWPILFNLIRIYFTLKFHFKCRPQPLYYRLCHLTDAECNALRHKSTLALLFYIHRIKKVTVIILYTCRNSCNSYQYKYSFKSTIFKIKLYKILISLERLCNYSKTILVNSPIPCLSLTYLLGKNRISYNFFFLLSIIFIILLNDTKTVIMYCITNHFQDLGINSSHLRPYIRYYFSGTDRMSDITLHKSSSRITILFIFIRLSYVNYDCFSLFLFRFLYLK